MASIVFQGNPAHTPLVNKLKDKKVLSGVWDCSDTKTSYAIINGRIYAIPNSSNAAHHREYPGYYTQSLEGVAWGNYEEVVYFLQQLGQTTPKEHDEIPPITFLGNKQFGSRIRYLKSIGVLKGTWEGTEDRYTYTIANNTILMVAHPRQVITQSYIKMEDIPGSSYSSPLEVELLLKTLMNKYPPKIVKFKATKEVELLLNDLDNAGKIKGYTANLVNDDCYVLINDQFYHVVCGPIPNPAAVFIREIDCNDPLVKDTPVSPNKKVKETLMNMKTPTDKNGLPYRFYVKGGAATIEAFKHYKINFENYLLADNYFYLVSGNVIIDYSNRPFDHIAPYVEFTKHVTTSFTHTVKELESRIPSGTKLNVDGDECIYITSFESTGGYVVRLRDGYVLGTIINSTNDTTLSELKKFLPSYKNISTKE